MSHRAVSPTTYLVVFVLLLLLLALTVFVADYDFGEWNIAVAMSIAGVKTLLIVWVFMHIGVSSPLVRLIAFAGILWFGICIAFLLADYTTRPIATPPGGDATRAVERASDRVPSRHGTSRERIGTDPTPGVLQDDE